MKVNRHQLRRIIKEEKSKLLYEQGGWGEQIDTGSPLIEFARAYSSLGNAVQEQVDSVVAAYSSGGQDTTFLDTVWKQNPNAIQMALDKFHGLAIARLGPDGTELIDALEAAEEIFKRGDE